MPEEMQSFPPIGTPDETNKTILSKLKISIEPILFLVFFSFALTDGMTTNILLSRTCSVIYHFPADKCYDKLDPDIEEMVQPYTTKITMYKGIIEAIISGCLALFIGPWSDSNGRKPFLVFPLAGYTLYYISWFVLNNIPSAEPLWFLLPSIFFTLSGGLISIFTCIFCYITDITNENNRAFRMAIVSSTTSAGIVGGYMVSYYIVRSCGSSSSAILYPLAIAISFVGLLYTVCVLPETITANQEDTIKPFFDFKSIGDIVESVIRQRPKKGRARLILAILVIGIGIIVLQGDFTYKYYALRQSFSWSLEHYNIYASIICAISVIASTVGAYTSTSVLRVHELYVALFALLMSTLSCVLSALSRTSIEYYIFSVVGCFANLLNPMLKAQITRNIARADLGKVFAFISIIEAFSPLIASPLYRTVYNSVLDHMPLAVFFLSAGFYLLSAIIVTIILFIQAFCSRNYRELIADANLGRSSLPFDENVDEEINSSTILHS